MSQTLAVLSHTETEVLPSPAQWQTMLQMADTLVKSGFLPKTIDTPAKATAVILKGRELGIPAMQSFSHIYIIEGKPTCSAELQLALLARGGVTWEWRESSGNAAEIIYSRPGWSAFSSRFDMEDAKRANLVNKATWKAYPANMLRARAISNGARMIGPDLLAGMSYTPEELGAEVDEDGKVVEGRQPVEPAPRAAQIPATVRTPAGESVNTRTGEIVQQEPPQRDADEVGATFDMVAEDAEDQERIERSALIGSIERMEKVFRLTDAQRTAKRTQYMGSTDFDAASFDGLTEYERVLSSAASTGAQK